MKTLKRLHSMGGSGKTTLTAFLENGQRAAKAAEQLSAVSLLMFRAYEAVTAVQAAIKEAPLSKEGRELLWQDFVKKLPDHKPEKRR
jgi:hypothetical protein